MFIAILLPGCDCSRKWDILSPDEKKILYRIRTHWDTWAPERKKEGTAPIMTFDELYSGLSGQERKFLDRLRSINPRRNFDFKGAHLGTDEAVSFKRIENQRMMKNGKEEIVNPQYLPENVYSAYETMMQAMEMDLGKRLRVESGYRSPAYQLYTFLFYLPKHGFSLVETGHWVALPGYSEHGAPHRQAIDFINQEGINGENDPAEFERLPEYEWLMKNASRFGFELSYPRGQKGITFEPWHWRYVRK